MTKFLTKQEIIDKLQSLPDLPIVVGGHKEGNCEDCESEGIKSIEVVEAHPGNTLHQEYSTWGCGEYEKVIWIS